MTPQHQLRLPGLLLVRARKMQSCRRQFKPAWQTPQRRLLQPPALAALPGHVPCSLPAMVTREGRVETWPCTILDYSETAIRAVLVDPNGRWPRFDRGRLANLRFQPNPDKPPVSLRCSCIKSRGTEAVFRMDYIVRGETVLPFEIIDAMEIKIDLINSGGSAY